MCAANTFLRFFAATTIAIISRNSYKDIALARTAPYCDSIHISATIDPVEYWKVINCSDEINQLNWCRLQTRLPFHFMEIYGCAWAYAHWRKSLFQPKNHPIYTMNSVTVPITLLTLLWLKFVCVYEINCLNINIYWSVKCTISPEWIDVGLNCDVCCFFFFSRSRFSFWWTIFLGIAK